MDSSTSDEGLTWLEAALEARLSSPSAQLDECVTSGLHLELEFLPPDISKNLRRTGQECLLPGTVDLNLTLQQAIRQPVGIIFTLGNADGTGAPGVIGEWEPSPLIPATLCPAEFEKDIIREAVEGDTFKASEGNQRLEMSALQEDSPSSYVSMERPDRTLQATLSLEQTGVYDGTEKIIDSSQGKALSRARITSKSSGRPRGRPRGRSTAKENAKPKASLKRKR
ncbi:hypothetical protein M407DRAFT_214951 [Tulasnella calospora MUT 4182]|uniref:Uncharacterized protein n=1 Tax=Tulasnella calospora MUT 4182 TaxID=1051891 RepID=A0A0C3KP72_9AGAM|nr:hypothetical protein M407DRAFT_214951 [Tulasnella calospora MUT 4182]